LVANSLPKNDIQQTQRKKYFENIKIEKRNLSKVELVNLQN